MHIDMTRDTLSEVNYRMAGEENSIPVKRKNLHIPFEHWQRPVDNFT